MAGPYGNVPPLLNHKAFKPTQEWETDWENDIYPFHKPEVSNTIVTFFPRIVERVQKDKLRVFVPLCGKTLDIKWLYDQGHTVIGVELSKKAVMCFFQEQGLEYTTCTTEEFTVYQSKDERIKIYCGDLFKFSKCLEGQFDGIWDRGSLTAINVEDRPRYVDLILDLLQPSGGYLLNNPLYDPNVMEGPPRTIPLERITELYGSRCTVEEVERVDSLNDYWRKLGHTYIYSVTYYLTFK